MEKDLDDNMKSFSRLQRAKHQYENLLIHAEQIVVEEEDVMKSSSNQLSDLTQYQIKARRSKLLLDTTNSQSNDISSLIEHKIDVKDSSRKSLRDHKSAFALQEEIKKLTYKLNIVSQSNNEETFSKMDNLSHGHDRGQCIEKEKLYIKEIKILQEENEILRIALKKSQENEENHRKQLLKAVRLITRLDGRRAAEGLE